MGLATIDPHGNKVQTKLYNQHDKMQLFAKFKKILRRGFRAALNFRL